MAEERSQAFPSDDRRARALRLIVALGGEQCAIPILLDNAWLLSPPTRPKLDEPPDAAKARAERMRAHNVRALLLIYRDQIKRGEIDERVRSFFAEQAELRIWPTADPLAAMIEFLGCAPRRGAPPRTAARNFFLAADIQELIDEGMGVDAACGAVFERLDTTDLELDTGTLRNIYFRETKSKVNKKAVAAEVLCRAIGRLEELRRKAAVDGLPPYRPPYPPIGPSFPVQHAVFCSAARARARVSRKSQPAGQPPPAISAPHARLPDYPRTWCRSRARTRVSRRSGPDSPPQSPRRTLVCPIIPVHGAGLARVRVCLEGVGGTEQTQSPRRTLVCLIIPVHDAGLARARVRRRRGRRGKIEKQPIRVCLRHSPVVAEAGCSIGVRGRTPPACSRA